MRPFSSVPNILRANAGIGTIQRVTVIGVPAQSCACFTA